MQHTEKKKRQVCLIMVVSVTVVKSVAGPRTQNAMALKSMPACCMRFSSTEIQHGLVLPPS